MSMMYCLELSQLSIGEHRVHTIEQTIFGESIKTIKTSAHDMDTFKKREQKHVSRNCLRSTMSLNADNRDFKLETSFSRQGDARPYLKMSVENVTIYLEFALTEIILPDYFVLRDYIRQMIEKFAKRLNSADDEDAKILVDIFTSSLYHVDDSVSDILDEDLRILGKHLRSFVDLLSLPPSPAPEVRKAQDFKDCCVVEKSEAAETTGNIPKIPNRTINRRC